ncbi:hypothetical protein [Bradyrhizobium sp. NAS96.2]|uniref:hypothetical protein n=1 Tax=Bradyrhizobium sp. NAS96.2 TaxID=1680160 RepID=UPI000939C541|nr:hypothetical protein [Bradyrhizobium sp. NAS96.2]
MAKKAKKAKAKKAKASAKKSKTAKKASAKKTAVKKKTAKATARKAAKKAAKGGLGCCTIVYDDHSEQVPNVTKQQCTRLGIQRGGTGQWNPGSCA